MVLTPGLDVLACGCGGGGQPSGAGGAVLSVNDKDFAISAPAQVRAGFLTLRVHNLGPDQHELIVVQVGDRRLPLRADGFTVDEDAIQRAEVGSLEPGVPGSQRDLQLHLTPGRYMLSCNMAGHYMGGVHASLVVSS
jgi:uncharacterized cupredoxin-like copper-binding protein